MKSKRPEIVDDDDFEPPDGGLYFDSPSAVKFISSGCALLDCAMGGGFPIGRIANIVGDRSTGKTLLSIEACANFYQAYPKGRLYYFEAEAAFDAEYARALGIPVDKIKFQSGDTVEEFFEALEKIIAYDAHTPALVVLDSLDALSDKAELERGISDGSYGAAKAKKMSELFRRLVRKLRTRDIGLIVISQVRDAIGVTFGRKSTRTGGRALDFYASQVLYLAQIETLKKTVNKVQRPIGILVKAKVDKNKVGMPLRDCEFTIRFGFGIDDIVTNLDWLEEIGQLDGFEEGGKKKILNRFEEMRPADQATFRKKLAEHVKKQWIAIEKNFIPTRKKYG